MSYIYIYIYVVSRLRVKSGKLFIKVIKVRYAPYYKQDTTFLRFNQCKVIRTEKSKLQNQAVRTVRDAVMLLLLHRL
jgi:hypothetical protein